VARLNTFRWGDMGASRTVVALHGITANGGAMTEPARLMAERGWCFIAPDMRGHGESTRGNGDFSFDALLADFAESVLTEPDLMIGHSFGGTLAQLGVERGIFRPKCLLLEDPVAVFVDKATPKAMLDWDEMNLPRTVEGLRALNPGWSELDAAWKVVSLFQIDFNDARAAFSGNAPWDLRPRAKKLAETLPTVWVLPEVSRFVPPEDQVRLRNDVGERAVVVLPDVGHSIHRDATHAFVEIAEKLAKGHWFA
jgi:pimeloyl-ACP methyl ester carboxylesterase